MDDSKISTYGKLHNAKECFAADIYNELVSIGIIDKNIEFSILFDNNTPPSTIVTILFTNYTSIEIIETALKLANENVTVLNINFKKFNDDKEIKVDLFSLLWMFNTYHRKE